MTILIQTQIAARRAAVFILPPADGYFKESLLKIFIYDSNTLRVVAPHSFFTYY